MSQCVGTTGKTFTRVSDEERARRAAKAREGKNRLAGQGHPATSDIDYTAEEWEFMQAIQAFKQRTGNQFPTWREVYRVFIALGYEQRAASEAAHAAQPSRTVAFAG